MKINAANQYHNCKTRCLQFYQDTLEIEEDKDQKEKDNNDEDAKTDKDLEDDKYSKDDDDTGSNSKYTLIY